MLNFPATTEYIYKEIRILWKSRFFVMVLRVILYYFQNIFFNLYYTSFCASFDPKKEKICTDFLKINIL